MQEADIRDVYLMSTFHAIDIEITKDLLKLFGLDIDPEEFLKSLKQSLSEEVNEI